MKLEFVLRVVTTVVVLGVFTAIVLAIAPMTMPILGKMLGLFAIGAIWGKSGCEGNLCHTLGSGVSYLVSPDE